MKITLSWSGTKSHKVAGTLRDWIPNVIQSVDLYVSSEDIRKGKRWSLDIARELESSDYGIICVTRTNQNAPWINFEAGALSKKGTSCVAPFLLDLTPSDVQGPLKDFQCTVFGKEDILKLLKSVNSHRPQDMQLKEERLARIFDNWWPELEQKLRDIVDEPDPRPTGTGHVLEKYIWQSEWMWGEEKCNDILQLEHVDIESGVVVGKRTSRTGKYLHSYDISGYLVGNKMLLTALHHKGLPIAVTLVLNWDKFVDNLGGIAIRPAGNALPDPPIDHALFHGLDFWASLVTYKRVGNPSEEIDPVLLTEHYREKECRKQQ